MPSLCLVLKLIHRHPIARQGTPKWIARKKEYVSLYIGAAFGPFATIAPKSMAQVNIAVASDSTSGCNQAISVQGFVSIIFSIQFYF